MGSTSARKRLREDLYCRSSGERTAVVHSISGRKLTSFVSSYLYEPATTPFRCVWAPYVRSSRARPEQLHPRSTLLMLERSAGCIGCWIHFGEDGYARNRRFLGHTSFMGKWDRKGKPKGNLIESAPGIPPCCTINRLGLFVPLPPLLIRLVYQIDCGLRRLVSRERKKLMSCLSPYVSPINLSFRLI